ncbi:MAG: glutamate ABC transporter substrate-binding protein [Actinomycetota bacterium]
MRRSLAGLSGVLCVVLLGACSGATHSSVGATPAASPGVVAAPSPVANCGDPKASLRPPAALPAPSQMPAGSFMRTVQDRGSLVAGVSADTLLFGFENPLSGQIEGFDIDVLHQISQAIFGDPNNISFRAINTAQRIPYLVDGTVDIVGRTFTINCARRGQVDFSTVYFEAGQRVLVRSDSKAGGVQDLGGQKVCATTGSTSIDRITQAASKPVPVALANFTDCLVAFQNGEVAAISTDDAILAGLAAQDPSAKVVGPQFSDEPYGLGIALAHPDFTRFVNGVLEQMRTSGTWAALYQKWLVPRLGASVPAPPPGVYKD